MVFSRRALIQGRDVNEFSSRVESLRRQQRIRYDLTTSNPTGAGIGYDWATIKGALSQGTFERYVPDSLGDIDARRQLVDYLERVLPLEDGFYDVAAGGQWNADSTVLTASTSEAYGYLFKLLCDPSDCVLVPAPSYPLIEHLAAYESVETVTYQLAYDGAWHLDKDSVRGAMKCNPKAIVVISPGNPTGSCITPDELRFLLGFGVPLIIDQVFAPYVFRPGFATLADLASSDNLVFVLDGLSKRCGLPQLKLAWVSLFGRDAEVQNAMTSLAHLADTYLSVNRPVEAALGALLACTRDVRRNIRYRITVNLTALERRVRGTCVTLLHYQAGWAAILGLPRYHSDDAWALRLLEHGVLVQPGWLYDLPVASAVVVSLLTQPAAFEAGLSVLCRACDG